MLSASCQTRQMATSERFGIVRGPSRASPCCVADRPGPNRPARWVVRRRLSRLARRAARLLVPAAPPAIAPPAPSSPIPVSAAPAAPKGLPSWAAILDTDRALWARSLERAQDGPAVLIGTVVSGSPAVVNVESLLAVALTLRGARVHTL